jgi:diacylglycerol kinase
MSRPVPKQRIDDHTERVHTEAQMGFVRSAMHAFHGVKHVFEHERNARIHLMFALLALLLGVVLQISAAQLAAVFFAVIIVFLAEIFNTAIERTLDLIDLRENERIKLIKDMSAGAVMLAAAGAVAIGFAIFAPAIVRYMQWGG